MDKALNRELKIGQSDVGIFLVDFLLLVKNSIGASYIML